MDKQFGVPETLNDDRVPSAREGRGLKRVLDVGNCQPDHSAIKRLLSSRWNVDVTQAHGADDAIAALKTSSIHLILINRKLDKDYSDGVDVIRRLKADPVAAAVPVMLVTNYPEHQDQAVALGAVRGFGKLEFDKQETFEKLGAILD